MPDEARSESQLDIDKLVAIDLNAEDLLRQRERVAESLKWLITVVFGFSFTVAGSNILGSLSPFALKPLAGPWHSWLINIEILLVFSATATVFYLQGTMHLDIRFASTPDYQPRPFNFILDFVTIAATMLPFIAMAISLDETTTSRVGFTGFFFAYLLLLELGLALLVVADARNSSWIQKIWPDAIYRAPGPDRHLLSYWMIMNSLVFITIGVLFFAMSKGGQCPTQVGLAFPTFLALFGAVTISRDVLDYFWAWPFVFPYSKKAKRKYLWPISWIMKERKWGVLYPAKVLGYLLLGVVVITIFVNRWDSYPYWAATCMQKSDKVERPRIASRARRRRVVTSGHGTAFRIVP
jgi:hypothetical protein